MGKPFPAHKVFCGRKRIALLINVAKLGLNASAQSKIDKEFEAITEGEELTRKEKLKTKWAALEALVGNPASIHISRPQIFSRVTR